MMRANRFVLTSMVLMLALLVLASAVTAQESGGRICVAAFHDDNTNGVRDAMEPLLADVVVTLVSEQGVVLDNYVTDGRSEPNCFAGLAAGTYSVTFSGGLIVPTGPESYALTLADGQTLPAQIQFGAVPQDAPAPASQPSAESAAPMAFSESDMLRLMLALGGAGVMMILLAIVGVVVYWVRYRRA